MKFLPIKSFLIICVFAITACNNVNSIEENVVFNTYSPTSKEYKNELAAKVKLNPQGLEYTFIKTAENNGKEYLDLQIKGEDFEAIGFVLVNDWKKLENIKSSKGKGYSGAELKGLKLDIKEDSSGAILIYKDLEQIVD